MARKYDHEYKVQAAKLAKEIGGAKAAKELGIPEGTIHTWLKAVRAGKLTCCANLFRCICKLRKGKNPLLLLVGRLSAKR